MSDAEASNHNDISPLIFVAETDPVYRERLVSACQSLGFRVLEASHGIHAWKILQKRQPDLIIAGWNLPEISGMGLLNLVRGREEIAAVPFVLSSRKLTKDQVLEAGRVGVSEIIVLPMTKEEMVEKITQICQAESSVQKKQVKALWGQGRELMKEGRLNEAVSVFEKVVSVYEHAEVYYNLGYIKTAMEEYPAAIHYFRKATEINNTYAKAFRMMATCYEKMGLADEARKHYQQAADLFLEREMDEKAEEALNQVLRLKPDTINVYNSLGILYRKRRDYRMAASMYRKAMKVNPDDENIYYNLARMYYETGDTFLATEILKEALTLNPEFGHAKDLLRVILKKEGSAEHLPDEL